MRRSRTPKEEVIKLLNEGWEVYTYIDKHTGSKGQLIYSARIWYISDGTNDKYVHHQTIKGLMNKGIIQDKKPYNLIPASNLNHAK